MYILHMNIYSFNFLIYTMCECIHECLRVCVYKTCGPKLKHFYSSVPTTDTVLMAPHKV